MFSSDAKGSFLPPKTSLHLEGLRETLRGCLGCQGALPLLLRSSIFLQGVFPLLGLMRERIYELEVLMKRGGAIRAWRICQEPWERACIFSLVSISSFFSSICKTQVLHHGELNLFVDIKCNELNSCVCCDVNTYTFLFQCQYLISMLNICFGLATHA